MVDWSKLKIAVCDGDAHYRKLVVEMLREKKPLCVVEGPNGCHDKDLIAHVRPDLVIGSLGEGDVAFLDLVKWLRDPRLTTCPGLPVIVAVAASSKQALRLGIRAGVDHFLAKPMSRNMLYNRIELLLDKPLELTRTKTYIGPDRRRLPKEAYDGAERRGARGQDAA